MATSKKCTVLVKKKSCTTTKHHGDVDTARVRRLRDVGQVVRTMCAVGAVDRTDLQHIYRVRTSLPTTYLPELNVARADREAKKAERYHNRRHDREDDMSGE